MNTTIRDFNKAKKKTWVKSRKDFVRLKIGLHFCSSQMTLGGALRPGVKREREFARV